MAAELTVDEDGVVDEPFINLAIICCVHKGTDVSDILCVEVSTLKTKDQTRTSASETRVTLNQVLRQYFIKSKSVYFHIDHHNKISLTYFCEDHQYFCADHQINDNKN